MRAGGRSFSRGEEMAAFKLIQTSILASSTGFCIDGYRQQRTLLLSHQTQSRCYLSRLRGHRSPLEPSALYANASLIGLQGFSSRLNASKREFEDGGSMDDEGVIRDMERYLEDLSLEYDSVWDTKPAW